MTSLDTLAPLLARVCRSHHWVRKGAHPSHVDEPLTDDAATQHLNGGYARGVCPITPGESVTRCALLDMDSHKGGVSWEQMTATALRVIAALAESELHAIPFRSSGGQGIHLYLLWREPQDAYSVREALRIALGKAGLVSGIGGLAKGEVEIFPKQDSVPAGGFGSMFVLPLNAKSCALADDTLADAAPELIQWRASEPVQVRERPAPPPTSAIVPAELATLKSALDAIPNSGNQELDYDQWRNVIFAIHSGSDGSVDGLSLALDFSARSSKHDPDFLEQRVWPYAKSERANAITARTIFALASANGWADPTVIDDFQVLAPPPTLEPHTPAAGHSTGAGATRFKVVPFSEFRQREPGSWIIKGVLPQAALAVVYGESGSGKSFFVLDLVGAIARGGEWRGKRVLPGRVVYICAEGVSGFRNRMVAYAEEHRLDDLRIGVIPDAPNFMEASDIKAVLTQLRAFGEVSIIVVDTFARVMPGANENSGEDVSKVFYHCDQIHQQTGALVLLVHHSGKDASKGARGWSGIKAALECEIEITRFENDRMARVSKLKDGEDGAEFGFKLRTVSLGEDADGDAITSCIVEHGAATPKEQRRREPKGAVEKLVQRTVLDLTALDGADLTVSQVIDHAVNQMAHDAGAGKRDTRRQHALRALNTLSERGIVTVDDGRVRVTSTGHL